MMNEQVRKIMTTNPKVASPEQKIDDIVQFMEQNQINQMPVVDAGKLVGMITTHDLWKNSRSGKDCKNISEIMSTNPIRLTPLDKVGTAAELFMDKRFKTLPVVNLRNELKGVVTSFDVLKQVLKEEYPTPILYSDVINA